MWSQEQCLGTTVLTKHISSLPPGPRPSWSRLTNQQAGESLPTPPQPKPDVINIEAKPSVEPKTGNVEPKTGYVEPKTGYVEPKTGYVNDTKKHSNQKHDNQEYEASFVNLYL